MKILNRVGEKYQLQGGSVVSYDELDVCEKIRLFQKEHDCDLETATVQILGSEEDKQKLHFEEDAEQNNMTKVNDQFLEEVGQEEDQEIKRYMAENNCDYETAMLKIYENKTSDSEENRFKAHMSGNDNVIIDSESGRKIKVALEDVRKYASKHYCTFQKAEGILVSEAIAELNN